MISYSFGCDMPPGFRLMTRTCSMSGWLRHSSSTPSPTIPVAPVMIAFTARLVGVRRDQRARGLSRTLHRAMLAHGHARQIGALPEEHQRVAKRFGFAGVHFARELLKAAAHFSLEFLNDGARRMIQLGNFHRGIGERATPRIDIT